MYEPCFELASFDPRASSSRLIAQQDALLLALTTINVEYLLDHPETPRLYDSGVVYIAEEELERAGVTPIYVELWADVPRCLELGYGDCEDLAAWLAAERIVYDGIDAEAFCTLRRPGRNSIHFHCLVSSRALGIEDPSRELGM